MKEKLREYSLHWARLFLLGQGWPNDSHGQDRRPTALIGQGPRPIAFIGRSGKLIQQKMPIRYSSPVVPGFAGCFGATSVSSREGARAADATTRTRQMTHAEKIAEARAVLKNLHSKRVGGPKAKAGQPSATGEEEAGAGPRVCRGRGSCVYGVCVCHGGAFGIDCAEGSPPLHWPRPKGLAIYVYELPHEIAIVPWAG